MLEFVLVPAPLVAPLKKVVLKQGTVFGIRSASIQQGTGRSSDLVYSGVWAFLALFVYKYGCPGVSVSPFLSKSGLFAIRSSNPI